MPKLQNMKRKDDSDIYSLNIPKKIIEDVGWEKGNEIKIEKEGDNLVLSKEQVVEEDGIN
jgi:antitoxin component of MazEF toxin-antitoxin module